MDTVCPKAGLRVYENGETVPQTDMLRRLTSAALSASNTREGQNPAETPRLPHERNCKTMDQINLLKGKHATRDDGLCLMEAVAFFAGESHGDSPVCACPVLSNFARRLNDSLDDLHRQELKPLIPALAISRSMREIEAKRAYLAADFAVRSFAPYALDMYRFCVHADRLRVLRPVVDQATAEVARKEAHAATAASGATAAGFAAASSAFAATGDFASAAATAAFAATAAAKSHNPSQDWLLSEGLSLLHAMLAVDNMRRAR